MLNVITFDIFSHDMQFHYTIFYRIVCFENVRQQFFARSFDILLLLSFCIIYLLNLINVNVLKCKNVESFDFLSE